MWSSVVGGGYWTKELPELDLVKQKNKQFKRELENFDMPEVYSAINIMQSTPFKINKFVYLDDNFYSFKNSQMPQFFPSGINIRILNSVFATKQLNKNRIYLTRKNSYYRKIINESDLIDELKLRKFLKILL